MAMTPDLLYPDPDHPPLITVLTPHRNAERFLGDAVRSVLAQTFADFQLVVIDDCSDNDYWRDVLRPYRAERRLRVFKTDRNVRAFKIYNALLPAIRSPFVAFQDADDLSDEKRFAVQLDFIRAYGYEIVGSNFVKIDSTDRVIEEWPMTFDGNARKSQTVQLVAHASTIMSRSIFDALGGFDEHWGFAWDSDFQLRASHLFRIRNVPQFLYRYRIWRGQNTSSLSTGLGTPARKEIQDRILALERLRQSCASREELFRLIQPQSIGEPIVLRPVDLE